MWPWTARKKRREFLERRSHAKAAYGDLYGRVEALFFRHDPIGINFEDNTDEYDPEVSTVLPRLESCRGAKDVTVVLKEEFARWFDADTALDNAVYEPIAIELWQLWQEFRAGTNLP